MENGESESELADLRDVILNYLQRNPSAADSLEGVMNWWLPQAYENGDAARIERALEQLIAEGQVRKITLVGGTVLYRQGESRS